MCVCACACVCVYLYVYMYYPYNIYIIVPGAFDTINPLLNVSLLRFYSYVRREKLEHGFHSLVGYLITIG